MQLLFDKTVDGCQYTIFMFQIMYISRKIYCCFWFDLSLWKTCNNYLNHLTAHLKIIFPIKKKILLVIIWHHAWIWPTFVLNNRIHDIVRDLVVFHDSPLTSLINNNSWISTWLYFILCHISIITFWKGSGFLCPVEIKLKWGSSSSSYS